MTLFKILFLLLSLVSCREAHPQTMALARMIEAEAAGECLLGKYLVGSVIVNRSLSDEFPRDLGCVMDQPMQFAQPADSASAESIVAAKRALASPAPGILYFYNPTTALDTNFTKRTKDCFQIGKHRFCNTFVP